MKATKTQYLLALLAALIAMPIAVNGQIQSTAFTYQGLLNEAGSPADGTFDFEFRLFDAESGGGQVGSPEIINGVMVTDGRFTVQLDFGSAAFTGEDLWMQIEVDNFVLSPRQMLTSVPYATKTRGINVDSNANIGIGTDSPERILHTVGDAVLFERDTNDAGMLVRNTSNGEINGMFGLRSTGFNDGYTFVTDQNQSPKLYLQDNFVGVYRSDRVNGAEIFGLYSGATSGFRGMYIETAGETAKPFYGYAAGPNPDAYHYYDGGTEKWELWNGGVKLAVGRDGYVGFGRQTPIVDEATGQSWFDVQIPSSTDTVGGMYLNSADTNDRVLYGFATGGESQAVMSYDGASNTWVVDLGPTQLDEFVIKGDTGRVGISTFNPVALLDVNGNARIATNLEVGINACKPGGGSWSTCSDERLKKNIESLEGSLDKLLQIEGVTFEYRDPGSINELDGQRTGVVAQQVEKVFPDWIDEREDGFKVVTFRGFEALAIEALRELRSEKDKEIERLEDENQDLQDRLAALEAAVESLTSQAN